MPFLDYLPWFLSIWQFISSAYSGLFHINGQKLGYKLCPHQYTPGSIREFHTIFQQTICGIRGF